MFWLMYYNTNEFREEINSKFGPMTFRPYTIPALPFRPQFGKSQVGPEGCPFRPQFLKTLPAPSLYLLEIEYSQYVYLFISGNVANNV